MVEISDPPYSNSCDVLTIKRVVEGAPVFLSPELPALVQTVPLRLHNDAGSNNCISRFESQESRSETPPRRSYLAENLKFLFGRWVSTEREIWFFFFVSPAYVPPPQPRSLLQKFIDKTLGEAEERTAINLVGVDGDG